MSSPHYTDGPVTIWHGDCLDVMRRLPDGSVDAVVTDPPYGIGFMGREWDAFGGVAGMREDTRTAQRARYAEQAPGAPRYAATARPAAPAAGEMHAFQAWCELWAVEAYRLLKPGGHLLAFGGTRTFHRLTSGIEDAGFEIRDSIAWLYGSGFPKSLDVSKAIDSRKDWGALHRLQAKVKAARVSLGISQSEAARRVGLIGPDETLGGGGFMWFETGMRVPTRDQYPALKLALGLDDECDQAFEAAEREVVGRYGSGITRGASGAGGGGEGGDRTAPATADAARWNGWGTALKPSHEPVVVARKPLQPRGTLAEIGSHLDRLEDECRHVANGAGPSSAPTRLASPAAKTGSAHAHAATQPAADSAKPTATGQAAASSAPTATSASESTAATFSNTVTSWRACWVELCEATNTSTTSTTTRPTTDLETLSSCLSRITLADTQPKTPGRELSRSLVEAADALFAASVLSSRSTRALSAVAPATSPTPPSSPDGAASAFEPIVVARKPLTGTVAANVLAYGTGALNIDGSRVGSGPSPSAAMRASGKVPSDLRNNDTAAQSVAKGRLNDRSSPEAWAAPRAGEQLGRWPANVVLDASQAAALDAQSGTSRSTASAGRNGRDAAAATWGLNRTADTVRGHDDEGGASRFFYTAKASTDERPSVDGIAHPTVKPVDLMRWLVKLVTPPGGTVLEPFAGSGTTVEAAVLEGFHCIAIEREGDYLPLILKRIRKPHAVGLDLDWDTPTPAPTPIRPAQARTGPRSATPAPHLGLDFGDDWELDA